MTARKIFWGSLIAALSIAGSAAYAAASQGLKWDAVTTYNDGTAIESTQKIVYLLYSQDGKQLASTFVTTFPASVIPQDACYYVEAALYNPTTNSVVPKSQSDPADLYCTKPPAPPPPPAVKKLAKPTGLTGT